MFDRIVLLGAGRTSGSIAARLARIAPLTILDISAAAIDAVSASALEPPDGAHRIIKRVADGTSRLVLEDVRGDPKSRVGLVIATGDDRSTLEATRLAADLAYDAIVVVANDRAIARECEKSGARALVRAELVGQLVEQSLQQAGLGITTAAGFGRGEILEFSVLSSSPAIDVPLAELHADGWRVAAIYRGAELVLPTGSTRILAEDRVLVIGNPEQLPHVAESLRVGVPTFPLLHGPNIVVYLPTGRDGLVETEAELLTTRTRAARLIRVYPKAVPARRVIDTPLPTGPARKYFDDATLEGDSFSDHVATLRAKHPGLIVAKGGLRKTSDVLLGRGGDEARLCSEVGVPILFSRGATCYERLVLCLTDGAAHVGVGEIALDLARMFGVPLLILRAKLPEFLDAADPATERLVAEIQKRARLHTLEPTVRFVEGNPIAVWLADVRSTDLVVVPRRHTTRDSFSRPDLALRLARKSKASVMVVTVKD